MREINPRALINLKAYRHQLSPQEYKTLRGQILAGDPQGAEKGLKRLLRRNERAGAV